MPDSSSPCPTAIHSASAMNLHAGVNVETAQCWLRPMQFADITDACCAWFRDPSVMEHVQLTGTVNAARLWAWIRRARSGNELLVSAICGKPTGEQIGIILTRYVRSVAEMTLLIGDRRYWGRNLGLECVRGMRAYLFQRGVPEISFKVPESHGFIVEKFNLGYVKRQELGDGFVRFSITPSDVVGVPTGPVELATEPLAPGPGVRGRGDR